MEEEDSPGEEDSQQVDVCSPRREERSAESDVRFSDSIRSPESDFQMDSVTDFRFNQVCRIGCLGYHNR